VKVLFFGVLKDLTGLSEEMVEIAPATTLGGLLDRYAQRFVTLKAARPSILLARNREFSNPDTPLTDQDEIAFLPPVSGGSTPLSSATGGKAEFLSFIEDESGSLFALTRRPIESGALADELQRGEDGAVIVFEGIVRNNTKGRATRYLEYECYEPMALAGLAR